MDGYIWRYTHRSQSWPVKQAYPIRTHTLLWDNRIGALGGTEDGGWRICDADCNSIYLDIFGEGRYHLRNYRLRRLKNQSYKKHDIPIKYTHRLCPGRNHPRRQSLGLPCKQVSFQEDKNRFRYDLVNKNQSWSKYTSYILSGCKFSNMSSSQHMCLHIHQNMLYLYKCCLHRNN